MTTLMVLHDRCETSVTAEAGYAYISQISIDCETSSIRIPIDSISKVIAALQEAEKALLEDLLK